MQRCSAFYFRTCSDGLGSTVPSTNGWEAEARLDGCQALQIPPLIGSETHQAPGPRTYPGPKQHEYHGDQCNGTPITLDSSAVQSIDGTVTLIPATDDETVFLTAKQTFSNVPATTVTVQSQTASLVDGNPAGDFTYNLTLPIGAPWLSPYSTPLPIVFTQQPPAVAAHYAVQASATGYAPQSFNKDISLGNATQDFALVP